MTNETIRSRDLFCQVPTKLEDTESWEEIIKKTKKYAPPEEVEGMEFIERVAIPVSKPVRRSGDGNSSMNLTRYSNPERDNLNTIDTKGLNVTCFPPRTLVINPEDPKDEWEEDLFAGFGRFGYFDTYKIYFWIVDRYKLSKNMGRMQTCDKDVCEDAHVSDNGRVSSKPPTKADYIHLSLRKIKRHGWKADKLRLWYDSIEHTLSPKQVNAYVNDAIRIQTAQGRIDWFDESHVKKQAKKQKINVIPLNCDGAEDGNKQRLERKLIPMMKAYVVNHETQQLCLHNNKVSNHEDYDLANEKISETLDEYLELIDSFVNHWRVFKTKPVEISYRVAQKIDNENGEEMGTIIDF